MTEQPEFREIMVDGRMEITMNRAAVELLIAQAVEDRLAEGKTIDEVAAIVARVRAAMPGLARH